MKSLPTTLLLFLIAFSCGFAQINETDSLEKQLAVVADPSAKAELLCRLSGLYASRNPRKAFRYASDAVTLAEKLNDGELLHKSYFTLASCYQENGRYDSCRIYIQKAFETGKKGKSDCRLYFLQGQNEWYNGAYQTAIDHYRVAESCAVKNTDYATLGIVWYCMAEYYRYYQEDSLAQLYVSQSIRILEKLQETRDLSVAYNIQAEIYRVKGDYAKALQMYIATAQLAYRNLDSNRIGYCFSRMGYISYMQADFQKAENYLVKSLEISEKTGSRNLALFSLKCLTEMYAALGEQAKCKFYAKQTIALGKQIHDLTAEASAYSALSNLYFVKQQYDSAGVYADLAYHVAETNEDPINMLNAIVNMLPLKMQAGKYGEVIALSSRGIGLAGETGTQDHLEDLYYHQYLAYEKEGKFKEAYGAFRNYKLYEDSLDNKEIDAYMKKGELELEYQEKHLADTLVYIENIRQTEQEILLQKQRTLYFILIGALTALLLSVITFILWRAHQRQKKHSAFLAGSNHEKELLLKEIHHRVKNNLQVVSSLLNLQKSKSGTRSFEELIGESQLKISNIAIVHELLYQSSTFSRIHLSAYIDKLLQYTLQTYHDDALELTVKKEIEDIHIPLDKSVPLALVINEIVTNSVKYAFAGKTKGELTIICKKTNGRIHVRISDNGKGMPAGNEASGNSVGLSLIRGFIRQLNGEIQWGNDNGCFFVFSFPYP